VWDVCRTGARSECHRPLSGNAGALCPGRASSRASATGGYLVARHPWPGDNPLLPGGNSREAWGLSPGGDVPAGGTDPGTPGRAARTYQRHLAPARSGSESPDRLLPGGTVLAGGFAPGTSTRRPRTHQRPTEVTGSAGG